MPKYAYVFSLTSDAISHFIDNPSDRAAAVRQLVEPVGGRVDGYYFMFGQDDGIVIVDLPDSRTAAAISLAVSSTGAFSRLRTHELIPAEDITSVLAAAKSARSGYRAPGA
ncbi:MAG: GYD domain-containing protein [Chloroflexi bacterium]|nr:GYD domain-containing protein [Chloroflexota bacterium]